MTDIFFAHPLTVPLIVAVVVLAAGAAGWNIRTVFYLGRRAEINEGAIKVLAQTSKDIKELLNLFIEEHRAVKDDVACLKTDVAMMKGERSTEKKRTR